MMRLSRSTPFTHLQQCLLHHSIQHHLRRLPHLLFLLFLYSLTSCSNGVASQEKENRTYPLLSKIPDTSFRCVGHTAGYYADPDTGCQVYHMCDTLEKQYSYLCPNYTLFNQKFMVCDHWYMVNCSSSPEFYELNHHIGEVPDSSRGSSTEVNIINTNALGNHVRDNPLKDTKSSSVTGTFKSPLLASAKPRLPSIIQTPNNKDPKRPTIQHTTTKDPVTPFTPTVTQRITTKDPVTPFTPTVTQRITTKDPVTPFTPTVTQRITTKGSRTPFSPTVTQRITTKNTEVHVTQPEQQFVTTKDPERPITRPSFTNPPQIISTKPQLPPIRETILRPVTEPSPFLSLPNAESSHSEISKAPDNLSMKQGVEITENPTDILTTTLSTSISTNFDDTSSAPDGGEVALNFSIPFVQTPRPGLPFTMMPGSVARRPGSRFVFTSGKDEKLEFSPTDIQGFVFTPLQVQPQIKTRTVLTSMPSVVGLDPHLQVVTPDQETQSAPAVPFQVSFGPHFFTNLHGNQIPSAFLQPPPIDPVSVNLAPFIPPSQPQSSSPINRVKQEFLTPLTTPVRNSNSQVRIFEETIPGALHIQFSSTRGNRDFFIPTSGLSLPAQVPPSVDHNSLEEDPDTHEHLHHHDSDGVHMTMVFPAPLEAQTVEFQLNPQCPRCHPAFLKPGECHPCVLIK